jgi:cysteine desulfurase
LLDNYCIKAFKKEFGDKVIFNSFIEGERIPGIINVSIKNIPHNELVAFLSRRNIFIGTGSACNNIHFEESKVMNAMGLSREEQENVLRISFDENNRCSDDARSIEKIKYIERNITKSNYKLDKTTDSNITLPDCESYRKIALKYCFNLIRKSKNTKK